MANYLKLCRTIYDSCAIGLVTTIYMTSIQQRMITSWRDWFSSLKEKINYIISVN
jgi:hypothetical protein